MNRFVVARHGNTFEPGEIPRRVGCRSDLPLTSQGERQACELAAGLAQVLRPERILAGPLSRTTRTAGLIAEALGKPPPVEPTTWLDEIDYGPDEGKAEADVVARIGAASVDAWNRHGVLPDGWIADAAFRIDSWRRFVGLPDRSAVLVTSNGSSRYLWLAFPDLPKPGDLTLKTGQYGIFGVTFGHITQIAWNVDPVSRRETWAWSANRRERQRDRRL